MPFSNEVQTLLETVVDDPLLDRIARPEAETPASVFALRLGHLFDTNRLRGNPREKHSARLGIALSKLTMFVHGRQYARLQDYLLLSSRGVVERS